MTQFKYKFQMYRHLQADTQKIYAEAMKLSEELGTAGESDRCISQTRAVPAYPSLLTQKVSAASEKGAKKTITPARLVDEIREVVKDVYGDEYDACPVNTYESGLWVTYKMLLSPPLAGPGETYRTRYVTPLEKHVHHRLSYGRPFPPKYKGILAGKMCAGAELEFLTPHLDNVDVVIVPLEGAQYRNHGIKYIPVPFLTKVDPEASLEVIAATAEVHVHLLSGFSSLGYDTPGYGYGVKDENGVSVLQRGLGELAKEFDVPYVVDNARGLPFVGTDPRKIGASVMIYSIGKMPGPATSGLIIGREDVVVPIKRALGTHGDLYGYSASYGRTACAVMEADKETLLNQIRHLKDLRDNPTFYRTQVDLLYDIVVSEFEHANPKLRQGLKFSRSYNSMTVELNYEDTWKDGIGFPVFSVADMYTGSNLLQTGLWKMGITSAIASDGNISIFPGQSTCDEKGNLIPEKMRLQARGLVALMELIGKYSGFLS